MLDTLDEQQAQLALYIRRSDRSVLPHVVGELRLGCFVFVFVLPFSDKDGGGLAFFGDERFLDIFPHYAKVGTWRPHDLSGTDPLDGPAVMRISPWRGSAMAAGTPEADAVARKTTPAAGGGSNSADDDARSSDSDGAARI